MYVIGGSDGVSHLTDVRSAPVAADGSLGAWRKELDLPAGRFDASAVVVADRLFVAGGAHSITGLSTEVLTADFDADGAVTGWRTVRALDQGLAQMGFSAGPTKVRLYGGRGLFGASDSVRTAPITADGIGDFVPEVQLPRSFVRGAAFEVGSRVALVDGVGDGGAFVGDLDGGVLAGFASAAAPEPGTTIFDPSYVTARELMFMFGGQTSQPVEQVWRGAFNPAGVLSWTAATALPAARAESCAFAHGDHVYVIGGVVGQTDGSMPTGDVLLSTIAPNGDLSAWTALTPLQVPRKRQSCAVR